MSRVTHIEIIVDFPEGAPPCCCGEIVPPIGCTACHYTVAGTPGEPQTYYWLKSGDDCGPDCPCPLSVSPGGRYLLLRGVPYIDIMYSYVGNTYDASCE